MTDLQNNMEKTIEKIQNHLSFFGYKVERHNLGETNQKEFLTASHTQSPSLIIFDMTEGMVSFQSNFAINRGADDKMYKALNTLSSYMDITNPFFRFEDSGKIKLRFESSYSGLYEKDVFSKFLNFFIKDIEKMYKIEEVYNAIKD